LKKATPLLADKKKCTGCLACIDTCKFDALYVSIREDGHLYPNLKRESCVMCGLCTNVCPIISAFDYKSKKDVSQPYAVWANNDNLRLKSSSGGAFAAIAENIIIKGGYVAGAVMDGLSVKHILINRVEDISKLQGSKYLQSNTSGIYKNILEKLKKGERVLFSGLPCQVAALINFVKVKEMLNNLYLIDMICGGVPSYNLLNVFSKQQNIGINKIVSFRNKENGWRSKNFKFSLNYILNDGTIKLNEYKNILLDGFSEGLTNRYSCFSCPYTFHNRKSDLTIADFWGLNDFPEQHFRGVSLVISHTFKGQTLLSTSNISIQQTTWEKGVPHNPRLVYGRRLFYSIHPARLFMPWLFKHLDYKWLTFVYAGNISFRSVLWVPYKIFNYIIFKISQHFLRKHLVKYLKHLH
jgi:coenzyme F420-reducing hydrogenase beta subunit